MCVYEWCRIVENLEGVKIDEFGERMIVRQILARKWMWGIIRRLQVLEHQYYILFSPKTTFLLIYQHFVPPILPTLFWFIFSFNYMYNLEVELEMLPVAPPPVPRELTEEETDKLYRQRSCVERAKSISEGCY